MNVDVFRAVRALPEREFRELRACSKGDSLAVLCWIRESSEAEFEAFHYRVEQTVLGSITR